MDLLTSYVVLDQYFSRIVNDVGKALAGQPGG